MASLKHCIVPYWSVIGREVDAGALRSDLVLPLHVEVHFTSSNSPRLLQRQGNNSQQMLTPTSGSTITTNAFVETTLSYALTYIARTAHHRPNHSMHSARITILADNDYYSQPSAPTSAAAAAAAASSTSTSSSSSATTVPPGRFAVFPTTLKGAHKTGLGSSAALVTALTAALLSHYLPPSLFDAATDGGRRTLHNLAQAAHCAAQGKVGSGFDVAAAVYGSCTYRRFSPAVLAGLPDAGAPGFAAAVGAAVASRAWDAETAADGAGLPPGVAVRMCDVDCGSQTVGMVKTVLAWRARDADAARTLWDELQTRNERLAAVLRAGEVAALGAALAGVRELVRAMGTASGVPIEPESQTALLDALGKVEGVYGGVVPGAGGFDALALLVKDDEETARRIEAFLEWWSKETGSRVRLLGVKGEMEGVKVEKANSYDGWIQ